MYLYYIMAQFIIINNIPTYFNIGTLKFNGSTYLAIHY